MSELSRLEAADLLDNLIGMVDDNQGSRYDDALKMAINALKIDGDIISRQPERDVPIKPRETTDRAWGIPTRQAVCPRCDYYLGHVAFLDDYKGKRITFCETCGQAIDWEGWEFDEWLNQQTGNTEPYRKDTTGRADDG